MEDYKTFHKDNFLEELESSLKENLMNYTDTTSIMDVEGTIDITTEDIIEEWVSAYPELDEDFLRDIIFDSDVISEVRLWILNSPGEDMMSIF